MTIAPLRFAASLTVVGLGCWAPATLAAQSVPILTVSEAKDHRGEEATVCGHPVGFTCTEGGTVFNLAADRSLLQVFIPKVDQAAFGMRFEERFVQRNLCATGRIEAPLASIGSTGASAPEAPLPFTSVDRMTVTTPDALVLAPGQVPPAPVFSPTAYRPNCDVDVAFPRLKKSVRPNYTADAMRAGVEGTVGLAGVVKADGTVGEVIVRRSLDPNYGLDDQAVRAAKQFRFDPGTLAGHPVPVVVSFEIAFAIKPPDAAAIAKTRRAAERGDVAEQLTLGLLYASGRGVPLDKTEAAAWFRKAADRGYALAQANLGVMYVNGTGVDKDLIEGHKWLGVASARALGPDRERIGNRRDALAKQMTPEQIAEAQKRASEWLAAFGQPQKP